ncbi:MAG: ABC transporter substrate-binding protein [Halomonadaceae bacterium]|nr:MAG: ABC transporter substrate-binding protein [Halomonadaceae bacterium]
MKRSVKLSLLMVGLMLLLPLQVQASSEEAQRLKTYVEENTLKLVDQLEQIQGGFEKDREAFYNNMDAALEDFVAFRRIAARVMGRYAREASPEQRNEFVRQFKRSLYDAYGGAMVDTGDFKLEVREAEINPRNDQRATVNLRVTTEGGSRYAVAYSMFRSEQTDWQVENIIVEGINIGLAFRDRFEQEMQSNGDLADVINNWSADVADLDGLEGAVGD